MRIEGPGPLMGGAPRTSMEILLVRVDTDEGITGWGEAFGHRAIPTTRSKAASGSSRLAATMLGKGSGPAGTGSHPPARKASTPGYPTGIGRSKSGGVASSAPSTRRRVRCAQCASGRTGGDERKRPRHDARERERDGLRQPAVALGPDAVALPANPGCAPSAFAVR